jgi:Raf kinase inhibitor-like YbhB/YbcL family protein
MKTIVSTLLFALLFTATGHPSESFTVTSPDVAPSSRIAARFTYNQMGCTGRNIAPQLRWSQPPAGTRSLAISVFDPDAPAPGGWTHWLVYGIPASARSTDGLSANGSIEAITSFGSPGYGGPCPPVGDKPHRYIFTVYALDSNQLPLRANTSYAALRTLIRGHVLAQASLTAYYGR